MIKVSGKPDTEEDTDMQNDTKKEIASENKKFMMIQTTMPPVGDSVTKQGKEEEYTSTTQESVSEIKTTMQPEQREKDKKQRPFTESKSIQEQATLPTIETTSKQGPLGSKQVIEDSTTELKLPSEDAFEL